MVAGKLEGKSDEVLAGLEKTARVDFMDHAGYQDAQAHAFAAGRISMDEAQLVYNSLGEVWTEGNGGWKKGVSLARKLTITTMVAELLGVA